MIHKNGATRISLIAILILTLIVPVTSVAAQPDPRPAEGMWPVLCNWGQSAVWQGEVLAPGTINFIVSWQKTTGQSGNQLISRVVSTGFNAFVFTAPSNVRINWVTAQGYFLWDWAFCGTTPAATSDPKPSDDLGKSPDILITVEPAMPVK